MLSHSKCCYARTFPQSISVRAFGKLFLETSRSAIRWDEYEDKLLIDVEDYVNDSNGDITKREVLSTIASLYDPVRYIQPIVVQMKIFFQDICRQGYCWDDKLNVEMKQNRDNITGGGGAIGFRYSDIRDFSFRYSDIQYIFFRYSDIYILSDVRYFTTFIPIIRCFYFYFPKIRYLN